MTIDGPVDTPVEEVKNKIKQVRGKAEEWASLPVAEKISILKQCMRLFEAHQTELTQAACIARGYDQEDQEQGHLVADADILSGTTSGSWLRSGLELLKSLQRGAPPKHGGVRERPDGTKRVTVSSSLRERLVQDFGRMEVVVDGDVKQYNPLEKPASVTGVLGAGNTEILNDIIDPLIRQNSVVVYKSNPVLDVSNTIKEKFLAPLIERGFLAIVYGAAEQGKCILDSPEVDKIIITGSHHTFDRIVWGSRDKTDLEQKPVLSKPISAELGSVNPYIIIPGAPWSRSDIDWQAQALVAYKLVNNAHVCAAPQVVVTCRNWPQRRPFLDALKRELAEAPPNHCFYPGIERQYQQHLNKMGAEAILPRVDEKTQDSASLMKSSIQAAEEGRIHDPKCLAPVFQEDLPLPKDNAEAPFALQEEAFCPVLYEVALDCEPNFASFSAAAEKFCHEKCWGSLTCTVIVDNPTRRKNREALDLFVDHLQFGVIGINLPASLANCFPCLTWGAFPGHTSRDIQSGIGQLGNMYCFENVQKSILANSFKNLYAFKSYKTLKQKQFGLKKSRRSVKTFTNPTLWRMTKLGVVLYTGL
mmetsp:Transcript_16167/g.34986  ORF Transcript_16167/g.34986 Transcript_16167/m.34986 type:complete len:588 (-) Transcript_16167:232-1995(-)|eukprot:CAMPEP_0206455622 /NCGR_PEP_ID=MMETSP0324_2-20121206/21867_1 /ASSEMBLY_ACC=CAM_ASM_000836 /TAXON_ID=2866 /ORGANISM="Crypthecodinium cohnii, Strain Seligo" /LENGTH=587 /DNA_ID=CAMNT_0053926371 /DNA_START=64 /DNA_END=1830 /DNA_ORIENTATION=+